MRAPEKENPMIEEWVLSIERTMCAVLQVSIVDQSVPNTGAALFGRPKAQLLLGQSLRIAYMMSCTSAGWKFHR